MARPRGDDLRPAIGAPGATEGDSYAPIATCLLGAEASTPPSLRNAVTAEAPYYGTDSYHSRTRAIRSATWRARHHLRVRRAISYGCHGDAVFAEKPEYTKLAARTQPATSPQWTKRRSRFCAHRNACAKGWPLILFLSYAFSFGAFLRPSILRVDPRLPVLFASFRGQTYAKGLFRLGNAACAAFEFFCCSGSLAVAEISSPFDVLAFLSLRAAAFLVRTR